MEGKILQDKKTKKSFLRKMCQPSFLRMIGVAVLLLFFILDLVPVADTKPLFEMCGLGKDWTCNKNVDIVPSVVVEICEACGNFWGNIPGFGYCCRCSEKIFDFCMVAVLGGGN